MRTILKIIAAPFVLALILIVAVLTFLSCVAGAVCIVACVGLSLLAILCLLAGQTVGCCAGVPGFPLWAPGPGRLAGGASAWCEVCGDGLYGELILMDKVSRSSGRRVKQTAARFFCWERRCGYRYNLHPALQGSGGENGCPDDGGSVCLRAQSEKAGGCVCLPLRSGLGPR